MLDYLTQRRGGAEGVSGSGGIAPRGKNLCDSASLRETNIPYIYDFANPANEDRYLAKWLDAHRLSPEARAVMNAARALYREFYANITHTPWMDWKIETWDVGYYQVRNAMKDFNGRDARCPSANGHDARSPSLREAHDALRAKLLPQIYSLGFLNPDVEYFE